MKGKWILPRSYSLCWCFLGVKTPHLRGLGGKTPPGWEPFGVDMGSSGALRVDLGQIWGLLGWLWGRFGQI